MFFYMNKLWSSLKNGMPKNFTIANSWHLVFKPWLRPLQGSFLCLYHHEVVRVSESWNYRKGFSFLISIHCGKGNK